MEKMRRPSLVAMGSVLALLISLAPLSRAWSEELLLSGSSMLLPLNRVWAEAFAKTHPGVNVRASGPGSGAGIFSTASGDVTIGASDLFLTEKQLKKDGNIVMIPVALEGTLVAVNLPLSAKVPLKMDGPVLAGMFSGRIRFWDDPQLVRLNPGRTLPHLPVTAYHRSDSSGTTFVLTDYLEKTSRRWREEVGRESLPDWPVFPGSVGVSGSGAMVRAIKHQSGAIGYVGLGWTAAAHLSGVALKNREGRYVAGSIRSIGAAGRAAFSVPDFPDGFNRSIVWDIPGKDVYPASSVEFWMVSPDLPGATMEKVRDLVVWVLTRGQAPDYTVKNGFVPLTRAPALSRLRHRLRELLPGNTFRPVTGG